MLEKLLPSVLLAADKAGEAILEVYNSSFSIEEKQDKTPITIADKKSHRIIDNVLSEIDTGLQIHLLSEEGKDIPYELRKNWEYFWLIDPLDGTKEFIERNGEFTVNIALIRKNRPILGVIYIPVRKIFYFSVAGSGAYKISREQFLSIQENLDTKKIIEFSTKLPVPGNHTSGLNIIASRSHFTKETQEFINRVKEKFGKINLISVGSSIKFCLIAEGGADLYPRFGPTMEWDTAAGQAIVEGAGGEVVIANTEELLSYNKEVLLNPWFIVYGAYSLRIRKEFGFG